ncbi:MAG: hypothetical protein ACE5KH_02150 [Candidatus Geothermarchaeales archaeon]
MITTEWWFASNTNGFFISWWENGVNYLGFTDVAHATSLGDGIFQPTWWGQPTAVGEVQYDGDIDNYDTSYVAVDLTERGLAAQIYSWIEAGNTRWVIGATTPAWFDDVSWIGIVTGYNSGTRREYVGCEYFPNNGEVYCGLYRALPDPYSGGEPGDSGGPVFQLDCANAVGGDTCSAVAVGTVTAKEIAADGTVYILYTNIYAILGANGASLKLYPSETG